MNCETKDCVWCVGTGTFAKNEMCKFCLGKKKIPRVYTSGTIRVNFPGKDVIVSSPRDPLYSLMKPLANEYWDEDSYSWKPIVVAADEASMDESESKKGSV